MNPCSLGSASGCNGAGLCDVLVKVVNCVDYFPPDQLIMDTTLYISAGVIGLDKNTSAVTINSTGLLPPNQYSVHVYNYFYITGPTGSKLKATFHQVDAGSYVYFNVYDSATTSRQVTRVSNPSALPGDIVFSGNQAMFSMEFPRVAPGGGVVFTVYLIPTGEYNP